MASRRANLALTNMVTTSIAFLVAPQAQLARLMIIHLLGAVLISARSESERASCSSRRPASAIA